MLSTTTIVLILFLSIFAFNCTKQENHLSETYKDSQAVQNLTGDQISQLDNGVTVRFPAMLVKQFGSDCIELFAQDDFKKYNGDGKFAVPSRLALDSNLSDPFEERKNVIVTGKMTFVKDVSDTSETCGIVTGKIFEITKIENF